MRLPWILWRTMVLELVRLVAITAGVLVSVVAFAGAIKPLGDGKLEPGDAMWFMLLSVPPMLAYVLPFAGGFAATMVYHRMSSDNELVAAQAGGVSLRRLLAPALATALLLAGTLAMLNEVLIPRFLRQMQRLVTVEAPRLLTNESQRGRAVRFDNRVLLADAAVGERAGDGGDLGVRDRVSLAHPMVLQLDKDGFVDREIFASRADLWFYNGHDGEGDDRSMVLVRLQNPLSTSPKEGVNRGSFASEENLWTIPSLMRDNPKFLSFSELRALKREPERFDRVDASRRDLALQLARLNAQGELAGTLKDAGRIDLRDARGEGVVLRAGGMQPQGDAWRLLPARDGDVSLDLVRGKGEGGQRTIVSAREATLRVEAGAGPGRRLEIRVDLRDARTRLAAGASEGEQGGERALVSVAGLSLPSQPDRAMLDKDAWELAREGERRSAGADPTDPVARATNALHGGIRRLLAEVWSKQNERWAMASSCLVMVLTGALTALRQGHRLPLFVYLWTFFPALVCLVTISGGQQTLLEHGVLGLAVMWGGVGALALYALVMYLVAARH